MESQELFWMTLTLGLALASSSWLGVELRQRARGASALGALGALASTVCVAGVWRSADVPWLWAFPALVANVWLLSVVFVGVGFAQELRRSPRHRVRLACATLTLALSVVAGVAFLGVATLSAGGV